MSEDTQTESDVLGWDEAIDLCDEVRKHLVHLKTEGVRVNIETNTKRVNSSKAEINRELLFVGHLVNKLHVTVMDRYHTFKGSQ